MNVLSIKANHEDDLVMAFRRLIHDQEVGGYVLHSWNISQDRGEYGIIEYLIIAVFELQP